MKVSVARAVVVTCRMRSAIAAACVAALAACGKVPDAAPPIRADSAHIAAASVPALPRTPITLDTTDTFVLEFWPLVVAPGRQLDETRRIVEHLQADLSFMAGFESASLLASGDGAGLLLVTAWHNDDAADRARAPLAGWLRSEGDTALLRRRLGTATNRVRVRRTVGTPPMLGDAAMLLLTRYALKPGHSFGALAALSDSNLAMRVLRDTAAQGGAIVVSADSGALFMLTQARTATALDPAFHAAGTMPFWAPFASREEQLMAVVAVIRRR